MEATGVSELVMALQCIKALKEENTKIAQQLSEAITRLDSLERHFTEYKSQHNMENLQARIEKIESTAPMSTSVTGSGVELWSSLFKSPSADPVKKQAVHDLHNAVASEQADRQSRESNLLFMGIPECASEDETTRQQNAKEQVVMVLNSIGVDPAKVKSFFS